MHKNFTFESKFGFWINLYYNLKILTKSVMSNLRTYLYLFIFPAAIVTFLIFYKTLGSEITINPVGVVFILLVPPFMIIFLVNVTISEWKNSVFLKRIHSAGVSKHNFIISIFIFNLILGYISFLFCSLFIFFITSAYFRTSQGGFYKILADTITTNTVIGIILGAFLIIVTSIFLGTIISGLFKSVALSQSITSILLIFGLFFSDMILPAERLGVTPVLIHISYFFPYKHNIWVAVLLVSDTYEGWIYSDVPIGRITTSFELTTWIPIVTSIAYSAVLGFFSFLVFKWDAK